MRKIHKKVQNEKCSVVTNGGQQDNTWVPNEPSGDGRIKDIALTDITILTTAFYKYMFPFQLSTLFILSDQ